MRVLRTFFLTVVLGLFVLGVLTVACELAEIVFFTTEPEVYDLRCEGLCEPPAIDSPAPHFSWKFRSREPQAQVAYELQVASSPELLDSGSPDLWASGKVESSDQVMVPYRGRPLQPRMRAWWRVRIFSSEGISSPWSEPQGFGTGISDGSMAGSWIGAAPGEGRGSLLRKAFSLDRLPEQALLHVNTLGYHEVFLNGGKVSDDVLSPAVSQLDKRSLIVTYDVTKFLREGGNELQLDLGSGWYKATTFAAAYAGPLAKAELDGYDPEGRCTMILCTDDTWEGSWNGRRDLGTWTPHRFGGEEIDARALPGWGPVDLIELPGMTASPQMCLPTRFLEEIHPVSIEPLGEGSWMADFGRIVNAMVSIDLPALPAGHVTTATFSDFRHEDGSLEQATQGLDRYISSGHENGDHFENRFNHHLFRYMRLDSLPVAPYRDDIRASRIGDASPRTASFKSSDKDLNRIHDLVAGTLDNLVFSGYMVDCASIERLGYGGDGNASTQTLQILRDASPLYRNWLLAWADAQREDGGLPHTAPNPYTAGGGPYWCSFLVQAPWRTYMNYGDDRLVERYYDAMVHWLDYVDAYTDGLLQPWPNTPYRGWFLGDWAAPVGVDVRDSASIGLVNNCALCQVYLDLEQMAALLGRTSDAEGFHNRYDKLCSRIHEAFFHLEDNTYASGSQIDMVYPLLVGAVPEDLRQVVRDKLLERTASVYGGHLSTGLVGVAVVTEWATRSRECDWMYGMLKQRDYPGYLFMLDSGATGVWEEWDGGRSHLHNCYNGIGSWFYQALGGIIPEGPGYRRVIIDPQIPEGLEWVKVSQDTPYGTIRVERRGRRLRIEIPAGVTATVRGREYTCGKHSLSLQ